MASELLNIIVSLREKLSDAKYEKGELVGSIIVDKDILKDLLILVKNEIVDGIVQRDSASVILDKLILVDGETFATTITIFSSLLGDGRYYEDMQGFVGKNQYAYPQSDFYIYSLKYRNGVGDLPKKLADHMSAISLIEILKQLADYSEELTGSPMKLIFFQKKKIEFSVNYGNGNIKSIDCLVNLSEQLNNAHDKLERQTIFKSEMVDALLEVPLEGRFPRLLSSIDSIYSNYLKSHLLYLEKFSYHDLKSAVDKDKMEYTKRIYGTVNDIQAKLIALPAAFLLVFSQFDYSGNGDTKNGLILVAAVIFSVILEILLRNQFSVLDYIEKEILHFRGELKNKDAEIDLAEFITSFGQLDTLITKQRLFLWIFRGILYAVPIITIIMFFIFHK